MHCFSKVLWLLRHDHAYFSISYHNNKGVLISTPNYNLRKTNIFLTVHCLLYIKNILFEENHIHIQGFSYVV